MKTISRRIRALEDRVSPREPQLIVYCRATREGFLDTEKCITVLRECGFLPTGPGLGIVNLLDVPNDLNDEELDMYLREHGAEACGFQRTQ